MFKPGDQVQLKNLGPEYLPFSNRIYTVTKNATSSRSNLTEVYTNEAFSTRSGSYYPPFERLKFTTDDLFLCNVEIDIELIINNLEKLEEKLK